MNVATSSSSVGIRELKNHLSRYLDRVRAGEELVVTDRGRPIARISGVGASEERLADLIETGIVHPPRHVERRTPERVSSTAPVSDLVADQRR